MVKKRTETSKDVIDVWDWAERATVELVAQHKDAQITDQVDTRMISAYCEGEFPYHRQQLAIIELYEQWHDLTEIIEHLFSSDVNSFNEIVEIVAQYTIEAEIAKRVEARLGENHE